MQLIAHPDTFVFTLEAGWTVEISIDRDRRRVKSWRHGYGYGRFSAYGILVRRGPGRKTWPGYAVFDMAGAWEWIGAYGRYAPSGNMALIGFAPDWAAVGP